MHARPQADPATALASWTPAPVTLRDELPVGPVERLAALLDVPPPDGRIPPLWHWMYFLDWPAQHELGVDGHRADGHFLPPLPDRRRMFAGGRLEMREPLEVGVPATRVSSLHDVVTKRGGTGEMVFVTERHEISQGSAVRVVEQIDAVYRCGEDPRRQAIHQIDTETEPVADGGWQLPLRPDPTLLFRFSAVTANAHRIHYDAPYTRDVEGYPDLVVHGPLLALLMLELVRQHAPAERVTSVSFRLRRPVFAGEHVVAVGDAGDGRADLRVATVRDQRHATAEVVFG